MTQSALALSQPSMLAALERELGSHSRHPFGSEAARFVARHRWDRALGAPLREFLGRPGKEFRGELANAFFRVVASGGSPPEDLAVIVEALHAGSLVVDDIQDDSDERRGGPALHRAFGTPLALNAGNWLYFWAWELLGGLGLAHSARALAHDLMSRSLLDCHYGQALDLSTRVSSLPQGEIGAIVRATAELKTGSLMGLSAGLGALTGGGNERAVRAAFRFGRELGSALQMLDDLGGILSSKRSAKGVEDLRNDRPTWPWAQLAASETPDNFQRLRAMAGAVANGAAAGLLVAEMRGRLRDARVAIHEHIDAAFAQLRIAIPYGNGLSALDSAIERLEHSYG